MNSRERLLHSFSLQPVDHIPLWLRFWSLGGTEDYIPFDWRDQVERARRLTALGLDDVLMLQPPQGYVEDYRAEQSPGVRAVIRQTTAEENNNNPILEKIYTTKAGTLTHSVRLTPGCPNGKDIHLFDDYNIPRHIKPPVTCFTDITILKSLLSRPSQEQMNEFHQRAAFLRRQREDIGVALEGGWCALGDAILWLVGTERLLYAQMDEPGFLAAILDVLVEWELRRITYLLEEDVDLITYMAWYEGSDFWTPRLFRKLIKPRLAYLVEKTHAAGVTFRYIITKGWWPIREDLLELGIDCLTGIDPVQDRIILQKVKDEIGSRICLIGGMNSAITLSQGSDEEIRQAVEDACLILGRGGGFILFPVDQIFVDTPWRKVESLVAAWRQACFVQA
jgi:uroporphyrinogen-III decarboxylase